MGDRLETVFIIAGLEDPGRRQFLHVAAVHLRKGAVAPRTVCAAVRGPIVAGRSTLGAQGQYRHGEQESEGSKDYPYGRGSDLRGRGTAICAVVARIGVAHWVGIIA